MPSPFNFNILDLATEAGTRRGGLDRLRQIGLPGGFPQPGPPLATGVEDPRAGLFKQLGLGFPMSGTSNMVEGPPTGERDPIREAMTDPPTAELTMPMTGQDPFRESLARRHFLKTVYPDADAANRDELIKRLLGSQGQGQPQQWPRLQYPDPY